MPGMSPVSSATWMYRSAGSPAPPTQAPGRAEESDLHQAIRALARQGLLDSAFGICTRALEIDGDDAYATYMAGKLAPEGPVYVKGAMWRGRAQGEPIPPGTKVRVRGVDGHQVAVNLAMSK